MRLIAVETRGQYLSLPGACRSFKTFELTDDGIDSVRALHPRVRSDALPGQKKTQEVARRDRFDFRPQPPDGVLINAG
jgi:hypothetical protein